MEQQTTNQQPTTPELCYNEKNQKLYQRRTKNDGK